MQFFIIRWVITSILAVPLDADGSSEHMVNLIIGAAVIVLVIFVGAALRRPRS